MEIGRPQRPPVWLRALILLALTYVFLSSINMVGRGFSLMGEGVNRTLITFTRNPFAALMVGIISTSIVQSSTLVSSLVVTLVGAGTLSFDLAVPVIMGANIGSSVTGVLVSLAYIGRRGRFRRAFAAAEMNDVFNILSVAFFFPLELSTKILSRLAQFLAERFANVTNFSSPASPLTLGLSVLDRCVRALLLDVFGLERVAAGIVMGILSLVLLYASLYYLTALTRTFLSGAIERVLDRYLFRRAGVALLLGFTLTALIHSSGVTTSLTVPLVTAGILTMEQVFPYTMGANVGTTVTAVVAGIGTGNTAALSIAFVHLLFNVIGVAIAFPLKPVRNLCIYLARVLAALTLRSRWYAVIYVLVVFFLIPLFFLFVW